MTDRTFGCLVLTVVAAVAACDTGTGDVNTLNDAPGGQTPGVGGTSMGGPGAPGEAPEPVLDPSMGGGDGGCNPTLDGCGNPVCGDGILQSSSDLQVSGEECDDGNTTAGDGCSDACLLEPGWICPIEAAACQAAECGDGLRVGIEQCDDGNLAPGDGCDETCGFEKGFVCPTAGMPCMPTDCGNGVQEGSEPCDDGNNDTGDGCSPFCEIEPDCSAIGTAAGCTSPCGDGVIFKEDCDDGNALDGDGCSATCTIEDGWMCSAEGGELPDVLEVPVTFRDFIAGPTGGSTRHPDFQIFTGEGITEGLVEAELGPDRKPVYAGRCDNDGPNIDCPYGTQMTTEANFNQWYNDTPGVNMTLVTTLPFDRIGMTASYRYADNALFPFDGDGWVGAGMERELDAANGGTYNFGFTSEIRYWFEYGGGEELDFFGDDDLWVFVNGFLAVDVGGLHSEAPGSVTLAGAAAGELNLEVGNLYEISLFHAERRTDESNFDLTLAGFVQKKSVCKTICGDGIVTRNEACDDGINDGSYGGCNPDCSRGPICGDGRLDVPQEACDDGNRRNGDGCSATCAIEVVR